MASTWYDKKYNLHASKLATRRKTYDFDEANNVQHAITEFYKVITRKLPTNIDRAIEVTRVLEKLKSRR